MLTEIEYSTVVREAWRAGLRRRLQLPPARQLDHLRPLRVDRLEGADGEDDVAVAAGAGLALDVVELLDPDLGLLVTT